MRCATDVDVMPGGSIFRDFGYQDKRAGRAAASGQLALDVSTSSDEFWPMEPIMLNIRLSVTGTSKAVVPAEVDPGYKRFRVMIRDPDGSVRLYRSPLRFCSQGASIEISAESPFVRDLPLFGQAGGYTFKAAGLHQVWAELDVTGRKLLRSNVCEINVLPEFRRRPKWAEIASPQQRADAVLPSRWDRRVFIDLALCKIGPTDDSGHGAVCLLKGGVVGGLHRSAAE
ncbi:hypothetical protein P4200_19590 [Pseudomonas aeruginosa]|nr:hypothetical protein [Pseudomonas aeruginosa]